MRRYEKAGKLLEALSKLGARRQLALNVEARIADLLMGRWLPSETT